MRAANECVSEHVVLKLSRAVYKKRKEYNRRIDNFFTSLKLAKILKKQNTNFIRTVNRGRREIPTTMHKSLHITRIFKHDDITLIVYQAKAKKIFLFSTFCTMIFK